MSPFKDLGPAPRTNLNVLRSSVNLDSPQALNEQTLLRRMSVEVRTADKIDARSREGVSQHVNRSSTLSNFSMADLAAVMGPPSVLEHEPAPAQEPAVVAPPPELGGAPHGGHPVQPNGEVEHNVPQSVDDVAHVYPEQVQAESDNAALQEQVQVQVQVQFEADNPVPQQSLEIPPEVLSEEALELHPSVSDAPIQTPHSIGDVVSQGLNLLDGTTNILNATQVLTVAPSQGIATAGLVTGSSLAVLGWSAGGFAIYQQTKQINKLEEAKQKLQNQNADNNASGNLSEIDQRKIKRIDNQITTAKIDRGITIGAVTSTVVIGGTTIGLAADGLPQLAMGTGVALGAVGMGLSLLKVVGDIKEIKNQSKVNERLKAGLTQLSNTAPEPSELTDSLLKVAEHANTTGKSRKAGKWGSLVMNMVNVLTGAAGIAFKFLVAGGAVATGGILFLAAGGVLTGAALVFGIYKWRQHVKLKSAVKEPLRNPELNAQEKTKHEALLKSNKYYALKQFVSDLQRNQSQTQQDATVGYFRTVFGFSDPKDAEALYDELKDPRNNDSSIPMLANALFRGKPILM